LNIANNGAVHMWWKTVLEVDAGNWKSPFASGGEVGRWYCWLNWRKAIGVWSLMTVKSAGGVRH